MVKIIYTIVIVYKRSFNPLSVACIKIPLLNFIVLYRSFPTYYLISDVCAINCYFFLFMQF